ncbi:MAG: hypothetical protein AAF513_01995 [Pseudomonadota bacterium]
MKIALHGLLIVTVALVSVALSEVLMTALWLPYAPFDVTGSYFLLGVLPIEFMVVAWGAAMLLKILRQRLNLYFAAYIALFCLAHALELTVLASNPLGDALRYAGIILLCGVVWWLLLRSWLTPHTASS